jgi:hypothetical protein
MVLILFGIGRSLVIRAAIFTQRDIQFLLFFAVSYATWLSLFSIQRYAIVLELLCAPLIILVISRSLAGQPGASLPRASAGRANSVMAATALLIALWSQPGDWFRRPWSNPYNPGISKPLDQPAAYFLLDNRSYRPLLPPVALLPDRRHRVPIVRTARFDRRIRTALRNRCRAAHGNCIRAANRSANSCWSAMASGWTLPGPASKSRVRGSGPRSRRAHWLHANDNAAAESGRPIQGKTTLLARLEQGHPKKINHPLTFVAAEFLRSGIRFRFVLKN